MILFKMIRLDYPHEDVLARNLRYKRKEFSIDIFDITLPEINRLELAIHKSLYSGDTKLELPVKEAGFVEL